MSAGGSDSGLRGRRAGRLPWGTGFYFGRLALNEMSVEWMVLYRFVFASLGMLPVMLFHRGGQEQLAEQKCGCY